MEQAWALL